MASKSGGLRYKFITVSKQHFKTFKLEEEGLCPPGVCLSCTGSAVAAQQFKTLVHKSRSLWENIADTMAFNTTHYTGVKSVYAFISKDCDTVQIVNDYGLQGNPKTVLKNMLSPRKHKKKQRIVRSGDPCQCPDCGQAFNSPFYLHAHLKNSGQKESCTICGRVCLRGHEMKDHLFLVHKKQVFICKSCPAWFEKDSDLKKHKLVHKSGLLVCGDCGRSFTRPAVLEAHSQMHAVRTCRACGKQFTNRSCYRKHRSICEPEAMPDRQNLSRAKRSNIRDPAKYICDYCYKEYRSRPQLKNHILWIHMDVRPHQCTWCGKRFYTPARLNEHTRVHTRVRNYECDICGLKLVSKAAVIYHRRRHTGEKPYACPDCDETFISASRRSEHAKRRHSKGNMLVCTLCSTKYPRTHELKKHMEKCHKTDEKIKDVEKNIKDSDFKVT